MKRSQLFTFFLTLHSVFVHTVHTCASCDRDGSSRLALGVSTENVHTSQDPYAKMSDEELEAELQGIEPRVQ
jgi:hypothetical protein